MKNSFFSFSFGCRVNEAEKEEIDRGMLSAGFSFSQANPAIYIINTCAVTGKAEREARQKIYQVRRKLPKTKIVVTGCAATYWQKNNLHKDLPVYLIVNNINKNYLVKLLTHALYQGHPSGDRILAPNKFINSGRILIKIQDGCQRFCSFCIVPYLRGLPKSIPIKSIVNKINQLDNKTKEVILTAINTEAYGYDTGETLIDLINAVINSTKISRISFGSIHPWSVANDFIALYKKLLPEKRLVNFFHIPLQSGSNKILQLMKRGYSREEIKEKLQFINELSHMTLIGTDIIVGFLDETDRDFEDTYNLLKDCPINKFHVFRFSKRQNTAAYFMAKKLQEPSPQVKINRAKVLFKLGEIKYRRFLNKLFNWSSTALFLETRDEDYQEVLLENQVPAWVKTTKNLTGEIKNVKITEFKKGKLFGKIV